MDNTEDFKVNNLGIIHNIDTSNYYSIYSVTTLIVFIMLLWFFIRTNISYKNNSCRENMFPIERSDILAKMPEFQEKDISPIKLTDEKYHIKSGNYGDVKVNFYDIKDTIYDREWDTYNGIYLPNTRTLFKRVNSPYQAILMSESGNLKDLNNIPEPPILLNNTKNIMSDAKNIMSDAKNIMSDRIQNILSTTEKMSSCQKEPMSCQKEPMSCKREPMTDYICYRCGKYAYECQCSKKIDVFNSICPYCKLDVKDCICYMTDYHTYMWRNRYFDREKL